MRGISKKHITPQSCIRFNPAYAGNIFSRSCVSLSPQVQPRVCGEYFYFNSIFTHLLGSTPRMRGIYNKIPVFFVVDRFNPAYAGNILVAYQLRNLVQVQPRVCGEYDTDATQTDVPTGSTPRMRGILFQSNTKMAHGRFNPAYAGNM